MAVRLDRALLNVVHSHSRPRAVRDFDASVHSNKGYRPCHPNLRKEFSTGTHGLNAKRQTGICLCAGSIDAPPPFHLAFPVHDLAAARDFYGGILGCPEGRSASTWIDFNLFGHQIVCHHVPNYNASATANAVDGDPVPVPHFGLAMSTTQFHELATTLKEAEMEFVIKPHIRFEGQPGEQWTMFFKDRSGNSLEFKAMTNPKNLFAKYVVQE